MPKKYGIDVRRIEDFGREPDEFDTQEAYEKALVRYFFDKAQVGTLDDLSRFLKRHLEDIDIPYTKKLASETYGGVEKCPSHTCTKKCARCFDEIETATNIQKLMGWRFVSGRFYAQPYCRECRVLHAKLKENKESKRDFK